ncbi:hypothetical protein EDF67_104139 [Sphingobacterium sp. JUb78]|nr:hypothetical protein [Sphingobacterium kitahiroshimense]TCR11046.1 hypothetical protein EDF67_104139 [Sphingobacterium sp. JUb78]
MIKNYLIFKNKLKEMIKQLIEWQLPSKHQLPNVYKIDY